MYLVSKPVLEGAPPLNHRWQILDDNATLVQRGKHYEAATFIFALTDANRIEILARQVHLVRTSGGRRAKIIVRELIGISRYSDIQLLLLCGANLVVPHELSYSKFLLIIESVKGQYFTRNVPLDINYLLSSIHPIQEKGIVSSRLFVEKVINRMQNDILLADEKGILFIFKLKPGLAPEQVLIACHIVREGDIITIINKQVYLFLSTCGIGDHPAVIKSLFNIPFYLLCKNWDIIHQDSIIIKQLNHLSTDDTLPDQPILDNQERQKNHKKETDEFIGNPYLPTPINVLDDNEKGKSP